MLTVYLLALSTRSLRSSAARKIAGGKSTGERLLPKKRFSRHFARGAQLTEVMEEAIYLTTHLPLPGGKRGLIGRTGRAPGIKHKTVFGNSNDGKGYSNTNIIKKH